MNLRWKMYKNNSLSTHICFFLLIFFFSAVSYGQDLPVPKRYVEDRANIIETQIENRLNGYLQELEQKTGAQMVVLTVDTTDNIPIEMYAIELATKWKLGQEGKDNGALIVVAKNDRAYRFEVGYGLEGILPDSFCGTLGRTFFVPNFKKGQFGEGIFLAALVMVDKIAEEKGVKITGMPDMAKIRRTAEGRGSPLSSLFFMFFILPFLFGGGMLRRRMMFSPYYWGGSGGPRGFGSGGSGGFGGFGGGMGGSFGGGGASGRW
ncbi:TPM domain-containing protein [Candidatus Kuenenia sp.]|uniref:TPM domain-containing protein n=1 Tax=Candidatus Kuenenia sp. TaxID=2499824 RepID=UPI00322099D3